MKALLNTLKNLPPEVRSLLAMMGLGSFAGIIYLMAAKLHMSIFQICIAMLIVSAIVGLGSLIISKGFSFRARKRASRMADELGKSAESGPASMDARAAIKGNNEKFFNAIREMRKSLGVNIYDLPWYIVIGDSGCGKTKLVNEGGLTFSAGKPEGYQLGTLNYNWWFTEDAIFIDMAGRLCNPQEDGDRREWGAFLETVGKGRRGFPINGALVCVSAEHLLEDAPEKIESDANTMLERLRDLQTKLGVTFGTYLLVTKCDKILGFMQFFDRAERDITMKNQMFGWSKPGNFNELYNPEQFVNDFDGVYGRLNDLRVRRLNDDAEEVELGLAYTFPEEFHELRDPLSIYIRTLFPMIKNPRVIKNLVFRGVYFTSATQQGGLILKHLTTRLGADAASQFAPLESMYPQPRPHFVKDLLFKKIFPEHGLVFRNEEQVLRHRRLAKGLLYGSFVGFACLMGLLAWSCSAVGNLISAPEAHVAKARVTSPEAAPEVAGFVDQLATDQATLEKGKWMARILSLGLGADAPIEHLQTIQRGLFRRYVVTQAIKDVEAALQKPPGGKLTTENHRDYEAALLAYLQWVSAAEPTDESTPAAPAAQVKYSESPLWKLLKASAGDPKKEGATRLVSNTEAFVSLWDSYRDSAIDTGEKSLPRLTAASGQWSIQNTPQVTQAAVTALHAYYEPYARFDKNNPDLVIREWMRIKEQCDKVQGTYGDILKSKNLKLASVADYKGYVGTLNGSVQTFTGALDQCAWTAKDAANKPLLLQGLQKEVEGLWTEWNELDSTLQKACRMKAAKEHVAQLQRLVDGQPDGLNMVLAQSAARHNNGATTQPAEGTPAGTRAPYVREVTDAFKFMVQRSPSGDTLALTDEAQRVQKHLKGVLVQLQTATTTRPAARFMPDWVTYFDNMLEPVAKTESSLGQLSPEWRRPELEEFLAGTGGIVRRGELGAALAALADQFKKADRDWGLASLEAAEYLEPVASSIGRIDCADGKQEPKRAAEPVEADTSSKRRRTWRDATPDKPQAAAPVVAVAKTDLRIPRCATRAFMHDTFADSVELGQRLDEIKPEAYIGEESLSKDLLADIGGLQKQYPEHYFTEWKRLHDGIELRGLKPVLAATDWRAYRSEIQDPKASTDVAIQLKLICAELFENVVYVDSDWSQPFIQGQRAKLLEIREAKWAKFRTEAFQGDRVSGRKPWIDLSEAIAEGWTKFSSELSVAKYPDFPRQFTSPKNGTPTAGIDWSPTRSEAAEKLFREYHPIDLLLQVARRGQVLLDEELQKILVERQNAFVHGNGVLPYAATTTTDVFNVLTEIGRAESCFQPVDTDKLDRGHEVRQKFFHGCSEWRKLLLDGTGNWGKPLTIAKIALDQSSLKNPKLDRWWEVDPKTMQLVRTQSRPQSGPFNFYGALQFDLGLTWAQQPQAGQPVIIEFNKQPIETIGACEWDWLKSPPTNKGALMLTKGGTIYADWPDCSGVFPAVQSPTLAICEILENYGVADPGSPNDRQTRFLTIMWRLCDVANQQQGPNKSFAPVAVKCASIKAGASEVGIVMRFTLGQPLPETFERLAPLPAQAPGGVAVGGK